MVADLDTSTNFYRALGLTEVYFEGALDGASAAATLHMPASISVTCRILKRPDTANFGMIGLFEIADPAPAPMPRTAWMTPRAGEVALVFYVADIDAALARATDAGATGVAAPTLFTMPHRSQREALLRDPDGILINLIERAPDEQFRTVSVS